MIAQFNSYTEITSYSGNTKIYIFRKKKKQRSAYKKYLIRQKFLGITAIIICIIGCITMPEDCGGCLLAGLLGLLRVIYN